MLVIAALVLSIVAPQRQQRAPSLVHADHRLPNQGLESVREPYDGDEALSYFLSQTKEENAAFEQLEPRMPDEVMTTSNRNQRFLAMHTCSTDHI